MLRQLEFWQNVFTNFTCNSIKIERNSRHSENGIDRNKNLIIQFPVFIQTYTQQPPVLYQLETVPVPIIDQNMQADSYTHLQVGRPYIALNSETYITIRQQELRTCKRRGYEF